MGPDLAFWLTLAAKMAVAAVFVILAMRVAERAGPLIGAMVATLPLSAAPAYIFVALDHDSTFIALGLFVSIGWNLSILMIRGRSVAAQSAVIKLSDPSSSEVNSSEQKSAS